MEKHDDPKTFDLEAWISGASRPERSVTVYGAGHLIAELDELDAQIRLAKKVPPEDRGITDVSLESLQARWDEVAQQFAESALTIRVRAITQDEYAAAHKAAKAEAGDDVDPQTVGYHILSVAVVEPRMTPDQVRRLKDVVGEPQIAQVAQVAADLRVKGLPPVSVPFSRRSSTSHGGQVSSSS